MQKLDEREREILKSFASRVDRKDPGALNNLGVVYVRKGMYEEAIAQFKRAIVIDSKFDLARDNLWYVYRISNIEDPDVREWKAKVDEDPDNAEFLLQLGVSYHNIGRLREAEAVLGRLVESNPLQYTARISLGNVLKARGRYWEALEHYISAAEEMADHPVYHTDLGEIYYNLGRTQDAITSLKTAIDIDNSYWKPHFLLSFAYGDEGQLDEALQESAVASRLNPSFGNTEANLSLSEPDHNKNDKAMTDVREDIVSGDSTAFMLGIAYKERGYLKEALAEFELALIETPDNDKLHMEIAKLHLSEGKLEEAETHLLKTLEYNPENTETFKILGCEHHLKGNLSEATACYLEAFRLNTADSDVINNLGVLLYQSGLREDAERMFKRGLNRDLYHVQLNSNVLVNFFLKEDYPMAENFLQHLENFAGKTALFYEKRALLRYKMDEMRAALDDVEKAIAADDSRSDALYLRALIFLREEKYDAAIQSVLEASKIYKRFTGVDLSIVCDYRAAGEASVTPIVDFEPGDDMINLLQASTSQRFDQVRDVLAKILDRAMTLETDELEGLANNPDASEQELSFARDESHEDGPGPERLLRAGRRAGRENTKSGGREKQDMTTGFEMLNKMIEDLKTAK